MRPRYHYELGSREAALTDAETGEAAQSDDLSAFVDGYLIFDRAAGNSPEQAIGIVFDVADAERIVALLNAASP